MAKTTIDFKAVTLEYVTEKALEEVLAIDINEGIRTNDLAKQLIRMGYPDKDVTSVARKLNAMAKQLTGTKANFLRTDPETKVTEKFVGTTWVGSPVPHEPWNQHIWHLPLWQNVNEIAARPQMVMKADG